MMKATPQTADKLIKHQVAFRPVNSCRGRPEHGHAVKSSMMARLARPCAKTVRLSGRPPLPKSYGVALKNAGTHGLSRFVSSMRLRLYCCFSSQAKWPEQISLPGRFYARFCSAMAGKAVSLSVKVTKRCGPASPIPVSSRYSLMHKLISC